MSSTLVRQGIVCVQVLVMQSCLGTDGHQCPITAAQSTHSQAAAWHGSSTSVTKSACEGPAWATVGARRLVTATTAMTAPLRRF